LIRAFYTFAWWLALPLVLGRLWWRGRKEAGYLEHWGERLGFYPQARSDAMAIWVHAVSVGETRASEPLVDALLKTYPASRIIMTHMTPTGRATGHALYGKHGDRLVQAYIPYDIGTIVARFLRHFEPRICILMETEVWPNLIAKCAAQKVPVALVNARLSERSLRRGQKFGGLMVDAARAIPLVAAQTEADAARIRSLGAPKVGVTGSIKFDVVVPQAALQTGQWLRGLIGERPVLLCASTRDGEEGDILDAWRAAPQTPLDPASPAALNPLLLLVPRHPQRFDEVAAMVAAKGLSFQRRSQLGELDANVQVLLGDSMGEMFAYYAACDCAFIGGSLQPLGGQNLIEACALGKPVLVGPHTFNFALATEQAIEAGGAVCVEDATDLMQQAMRLLANGAERASMGERALGFANQHRGATARTMDLIEPYIAAGSR
jgi:3-deoxy-D-manno-octulosonic-acid transferase